MSALNPRVQKDELKTFLGKKVMIGTQSYHYLSGRLSELLDNELVLLVKNRSVTVSLADVATIQEAPEAQSEYIK